MERERLEREGVSTSGYSSICEGVLRGGETSRYAVGSLRGVSRRVKLAVNKRTIFGARYVPREINRGWQVKKII